MKQLILLIALISLLIPACQGLTTEADVEINSTSTIIAQTLEAAVTSTTASTQPASSLERTEAAVNVPAGIATNTPETLSPGVMPANTKTPAPSASPGTDLSAPPADIEITVPGALSKVISPIPIRAMLVPGHRGRVTIELIGEDGRVIAQETTFLNPDLGRKAGMVMELPFEIPSEVEFSRLVISRQDEYGRTTALSSTELVLLSSGQSDHNVVVDQTAPVSIQEPQMNAIIQGDRVIIAGVARQAVSSDYVIELVAQDGSVISQSVFNVSTLDSAKHLPFVIEIPFTLENPTWVLLLIRENGDRIPGIVYLTSTEVLLSP